MVILCLNASGITCGRGSSLNLGCENFYCSAAQNMSYLCAECRLQHYKIKIIFIFIFANYQKAAFLL